MKDCMYTASQYRQKAIEYGARVLTANGPNERREFQALEKTFNTLADNAQWLADNRHKTVCRISPDVTAD